MDTFKRAPHNLTLKPTRRIHRRGLVTDLLLCRRVFHHHPTPEVLKKKGSASSSTHRLTRLHPAQGLEGRKPVCMSSSGLAIVQTEQKEREDQTADLNEHWIVAKETLGDKAPG